MKAIRPFSAFFLENGAKKGDERMHINLHSMIKRERPLFHKGPISVSLSPVPYVIFGIILSAVMLTLIQHSALVLEKFDGSEWGIWGNAFNLQCFTVLIGLLFVFRIRLQGKIGFFISSAMYMMLPFITYLMIEYANEVDALAREPQLIFMNVIFIAVVYLLFLAIFGSYRWSGFIAIGMFYAFAVACHFVLLFRGTPFVPLDILAAGTGLNVASNYVFVWTVPLMCVTVWSGLMLGVVYQLGRGNLVRMRWKVSLRVLAIFVVVGIVSVFYSQAYLQTHHYVISYWDQESNYEEYGNWMAFCLNIRNVFPEKPEGYSPEKVAKTVDAVMEEQHIAANGKGANKMISGKNEYIPTEKKPNIIMVMNESFADLNTLGPLHTNIEVMPFFNSLKENTIRGSLQVSTHGGGTACTEYEALTGNSQSFLSPGAVAYCASMRDATPSMVWNLRAQGYQADALHPYYANGWSRQKAYAYMGFEQFVTLEDLVSPQIIDMTAAERIVAIEEELDRTDGDVYNRDYMSDHYDFKLIEQMYEKRDPSKPYFMFNVTIQNHGGYLDPCSNFAEEVYITDMKGNYPQANRYLSLMHASDNAFRELIGYFDAVKEPTIVVMFGDHLPSLEKEFYTELCGQAPETFDIHKNQAYHQTPFVIWANYDIPEKDLGTVSANYLSPLIMETAGLELTAYECYLASLFKSMPVISNLGYVDGKGEAYYQIPENKEALQALLNAYQCVAYNNLLDERQRDWPLFTHQGEALPSVKPFSCDEK